ncbi:MAG: glycosyltransferase [Sphaerochaetaceae bacterium]|jgi:glycosyltransferase involved in cell wall biosynthesis|nr:glycosyltransferase [Sphaerochaetaceae bacterium]
MARFNYHGSFYMRKPTIIHLITSLGRGGAERQLATIVNHSDETQNIICSFHDRATGYLEDPNKIKTLKSKKFIGRLFEIRSILRVQKPDLIYAWAPLPYVLASFAVSGKRTKVVNGSIRHGIFKESFHGHFRKWLLQRSRYVVANSYAGLKANGIEKGYVLYNGIDPKFDKANWKQESKEGSSKVLNLLSIANLVPVKDYFTVLEALKKIRDDGLKFQYSIVGEGPLRIEVEQRIKELGLSEVINLLGRVSDPETYLNQADIFIHSSKGEGCSNAILEAMYMALPVIASDTGGTSEIVGSNAILFEYKNIQQLYEAIKKLLQDECLRKDMADESYKIANSRFSVSRMLSEYDKIVKQVICGQ